MLLMVDNYALSERALKASINPFMPSGLSHLDSGKIYLHLPARHAARPSLIHFPRGVWLNDSILYYFSKKLLYLGDRTDRSS